MSLTRITFTGADESVPPADLAALSAAHQHVEFGILCSDRRSGLPRYPGLRWLHRLQACGRDLSLALALHLCGQYARDVLAGQPVAARLGPWLEGFQRVQLNVGAVPLPDNYDPDRLVAALQQFGQRQLIFQVSGEGGDNYLEDAGEWGDADTPLHCVPLFDMSRGSGTLPPSWPAPYVSLISEYSLYGYAGGLGPDTLAAQLPRILEAAGDCPIWIDMESGVRTGDRFDLGKVERCLRIVEPFVKEEKR